MRVQQRQASALNDITPPVQQSDLLERGIMIGSTFLSSLCLVYRPAVAFDPANVTTDYTFWTILTCNMACDAILPLVANFLIVLYVVNQLETVWKP